MQFDTLKVSAEFRRVRGGVRVATPWFIIEGRHRAGDHHCGSASRQLDIADDLVTAPVPSGQPQPCHPVPRIGFTITRKVGNAVVRNRIRRRLKEALRLIEPALANPQFDYVVVASRSAHDYPFVELQDALRTALGRLAEQHRSGKGGAKARPDTAQRQRRKDGAPGKSGRDDVGPSRAGPKPPPTR